MEKEYKPLYTARDIDCIPPQIARAMPPSYPFSSPFWSLSRRALSKVPAHTDLRNQHGMWSTKIPHCSSFRFREIVEPKGIFGDLYSLLAAVFLSHSRRDNLEAATVSEHCLMTPWDPL